MEIDVEELEILNTCDELPFTIDDNTTALEDTRLKIITSEMKNMMIKKFY